MDNATPLPEKIIFREPSDNAYGFFMLHKSIFVIDGHNTAYSGRCDNMTYALELPTHNTVYHDEGIYVGETSPYTGHYLSRSDVAAFQKIIDAAPNFCITYMTFISQNIDGSVSPAQYIADGDFPGALWFGKSLIELLKTIREWSFMVEEPFNSDHPMAVYSKLVFDTLETPQFIFEELDSLPDMHLSRFLKGDPNHRSRVSGFPQMSDNMMKWFKEKLLQFPPKTTNQRLLEIEI